MLVTLARTSLFLGTFPYKYDEGENVLQFTYFGATMSVISCSMILYLFLTRARGNNLTKKAERVDRIKN